MDTALYLAIISEYDLSSGSGLQAAKDTLNSLAEGFKFEEASGFDPSASSGGGFLLPEDSSQARSESGLSAPEWSSTTDSTSISQGLSALELGSAEASPTRGTRGKEPSKEKAESAHNAQWEALETAAKEALLMETFPTAKPFDIKWTLKKCNGDASLAIDELLNQSFLDQSGGRHKGIEAFSESDIAQKPRKSKGKKKRSKITALSDHTEDTPTSLETSTKWNRAKDDVEFIAERTNMLPQQISSMYHKHGGSLGATISALIDAHIAIGLETKDNSTQRAAQALQPTYPSIQFTRLLAIIQLTHPSHDHASDLAQALTTRPSPGSGHATPIQLDLRYAPPDLGDTSASPIARPSTPATSLYPESSQPYLPNTSKELSSLRSQAFTSASTAYRKGKSNPLMGAAAGYYASVGRDLSSRMHASTATEMDMLVSAQSTSDMCDLHGCDVKNGVRIARERVRGWWASKGGSVHAGYTVVTGKGMHSEGGRSRLQPAVVRMLMSEGWRVEVLSGSVVVRGVVSPVGGKKK